MFKKNNKNPIETLKALSRSSLDVEMFTPEVGGGVIGAHAQIGYHGYFSRHSEHGEDGAMGGTHGSVIQCLAKISLLLGLISHWIPLRKGFPHPNIGKRSFAQM